jgi:3-oxoacyl-[acyl-carrier protein] reductase
MSPGGNAPMGTDSATSKPLAGMNALITGASRGIGLAIARKLAQLGARLSLCARDAARLDAAGADLRRDGFEALTMVADVAHANEIQNLVDRTHRELGPIEILVNNAGIGRFGPAHQMNETDWDAVLDTNLKSVFLVTRAVAPRMIERKRGHIVNISSLAGKNAFAGGGIYCASKWGLMGLTACRTPAATRKSCCSPTTWRTPWQRS